MSSHLVKILRFTAQKYRQIWSDFDFDQPINGLSPGDFNAGRRPTVTNRPKNRLVLFCWGQTGYIVRYGR